MERPGVQRWFASFRGAWIPIFLALFWIADGIGYLAIHDWWLGATPALALGVAYVLLAAARRRVQVKLAERPAGELYRGLAAIELPRRRLTTSYVAGILIVNDTGIGWSPTSVRPRKRDSKLAFLSPWPDIANARLEVRTAKRAILVVEDSSGTAHRVSTRDATKLEAVIAAARAIHADA